MMLNKITISEADWKVWKALRLRTIDKFCEQTFSQLQQLIDGEAAIHDRHRLLYQLVTERDQQIEELFDPLTRNRSLHQLLNLYRVGLIEDEDLSPFSDELQYFVQERRAL